MLFRWSWHFITPISECSISTIKYNYEEYLVEMVIIALLNLLLVNIAIEIKEPSLNIPRNQKFARQFRPIVIFISFSRSL